VEETGIPGENHRLVASHCLKITKKIKKNPTHEAVNGTKTDILKLINIYNAGYKYLKSGMTYIQN
jgi:hypothetical protein